MRVSCPFCQLLNSEDNKRIIAENGHAVAISDAFPISVGHTLIVPKRHTGSFFETSEIERQAMLSLIDTAKQLLDIEHAPSAYNIGINDGPAAGQTVNHLHIHLIPRFNGDVDDPRGGVRWVIPENADYWSTRSD